MCMKPKEQKNPKKSFMLPKDAKLEFGKGTWHSLMMKAYGITKPTDQIVLRGLNCSAKKSTDSAQVQPNVNVLPFEI